MSDEAVDPGWVEYLREHDVYNVVDDAVTALVRARPEDPAGWLARRFSGEPTVPPQNESDAAYLCRTGVRELLNAAILELVAAKPADPARHLGEACRRHSNEHASAAAATTTPTTGNIVLDSPRRRRFERSPQQHEDTPPNSPGGLVRGRSFISDWTSQLQRYYLKVDHPGLQVTVHAGPSGESPVTGTKREYDGIAVDKEEGEWLRITEGTGWVCRGDPGKYSWVPMGTEAGIVVQDSQIPGGFRVGQRVSSYADRLREGEVVGGEDGKVLVRWDDADAAAADAAPTQEEVSALEIVSTRMMRRAPTMCWGSGLQGQEEYLVPPQDKSKLGLPIVVFDLDETLVYARQGPLHARSGVRELFAMLKDKAEVLVWTAGMRAYAQTIIKEIDPDNVVSHCVYRHPKWHPQFATAQNKDLKALGRPLVHTLLVENSPDSIVGNEQNAVLLQDYVAGGESDATIPTLYKLLRDFVYDPVRTVPDFLAASEYVKLTPMTVGEKETACYVLRADPQLDASGISDSAVPLARQLSNMSDPNPQEGSGQGEGTQAA